MYTRLSGSKSAVFNVLSSNENVEINYYYVIVLISFLLFNFNAQYILIRIAPRSARQSGNQLWKWRNIANSFIHSVLSGVAALINFKYTPELRNELINIYTLFSHFTLCFSVGYFIYDFIDMARYHKRTSTYELLIHHTLVVICFGLAVKTKFYQGYALVALLIEINSIFLHIRQLLIIQGWRKNRIFYKINSYLNLVTFIVFRLLNLTWMIFWLISNHGNMNVGLVTVIFTALALIFFLIHSLKLLRKILISDGYVQKHLRIVSTPSGNETAVSRN